MIFVKPEHSRFWRSDDPARLILADGKRPPHTARGRAVGPLPPTISNPPLYFDAPLEALSHVRTLTPQKSGPDAIPGRTTIEPLHNSTTMYSIYRIDPSFDLPHSRAILLAQHNAETKPTWIVCFGLGLRLLLTERAPAEAHAAACAIFEAGEALHARAVHHERVRIYTAHVHGLLRKRRLPGTNHVRVQITGDTDTALDLPAPEPE